MLNAVRKNMYKLPELSGPQIKHVMVNHLSRWEIDTIKKRSVPCSDHQFTLRTQSLASASSVRASISVLDNTSKKLTKG